MDLVWNKNLFKSWIFGVTYILVSYINKLKKFKKFKTKLQINPAILLQNTICTGV